MLPLAIRFVLSLSILLISSRLFLGITQTIAAKWKFSPLFVSLVIVALGTNLPELTVTIAALLNHDAGLAMANLTGSSIANITLIFGFSVLIGSIRIGTSKTPKNALILLTIAILFTLLQFSGLGHNLRAGILIFSFLIAVIYQYLLAANGRFHEDKKLIAAISRTQNHKKKVPLAVFAVMFLGSIGGLLLAGNLFVSAIEDLSLLLEISTTTLGLTLTAIATSAPELVMSIMAAMRKDSQDSKVVIGTLIGSNILNLTLLPALVLLTTQDVQVAQGERVFLLVSTILLTMVIFFKKGTVVTKKIGLIFVGLFVLFAMLTFVI